MFVDSKGLVFLIKRFKPTFLNVQDVCAIISAGLDHSQSCSGVQLWEKNEICESTTKLLQLEPASSPPWCPFKCFYWTAADVWQAEACEHLTCRRNLLFDPPLPRPNGGLRGLLFWLRFGSGLQGNSSLAHLTAPPSSLLAQTFSDSSAAQLDKLTQELSRFWTRRSNIAEFCGKNHPTAEHTQTSTFMFNWNHVWTLVVLHFYVLFLDKTTDSVWRQHSQDNPKLLHMVIYF